MRELGIDGAGGAAAARAVGRRERNAWRWRARWPAARARCCSTSRWRRWTSACGAPCGSRWRATSAGSALPTVLVTHDIADAAALATSIVVVEAGKVVQQGTAAELAARPATAFVEELTATATVSLPIRNHT